MEIAPRFRPERFADVATFVPTFLYESLGNLIICVGLVLIDRYRRPRPGWLMAMYLLAYAALLAQPVLAQDAKFDPGPAVWIEEYWDVKPDKFAEFMAQVGTLKVKPADWKELFFPEVHGLPGS